jgi:hypothetical protein
LNFTPTFWHTCTSRSDFLFEIKPDQWTAIAAIAQVLAAFATLAAVLFAIYQWNHQWRPKLRVSLDTVLIPKHSGSPEKYIGLMITNIGICTVQITGVQYRPHRFAKMRWFHAPDFKIPHCSKLPKKLEQTDSASLFWTYSDWDNVISEAIEKYIAGSRLYKFLWRRLLVVEVNTSVGVSFGSKLSHRLVLRLDDRINNSSSRDTEL